jgi:hypothetical protein
MSNYTGRRRIVTAVFDAVDVIIEVGNVQPEDAIFWIQTLSTSRGIKPSGEYVAKAIQEKLERDLELPKGMIEVVAVKANHG